MKNLINNYLQYCIFIFLLVSPGCKTINENKLKYEKSPYLLQHKNNPVWWHTWGEEAFKLAKKNNKIILLSIGYSTCHWCHVMEKESFEDIEVAKILNKHFISIKVDREERPDVDKIYMNALNMMGSRGGWPLNIFLTPDLVPIFGGTYFPKKSFIQILNKINKVWNDSSGKKTIIKNSNKLLAALRSSVKKNSSPMDLDDLSLKNAFEKLKSSFDKINGGFGGAPKFPPTMSLQLLLRIVHRSNKDQTKQAALNIINTTLTQMFKGGIYDHLGGGFHRYATDYNWHTPHFEKMLYSNALLSSIYFDAFSVTKNNLYSQVGRDILNYIIKEMRGKEGGFYSAEDADSDGVEGKFYVWKKEEIKQVLTSTEFQQFSNTFPIFKNSSNNKFEAIINLLDSSQIEKSFSKPMTEIKNKLLKQRNKRNRPLRDEKYITSWNALMASAMIKGHIQTKHMPYLYAASGAISFIEKNMIKNNQLFRRFKDGEVKYLGTLDDYAYTIQAFIDYYQISFNSKWIELAVRLQNLQINNFWSEELNAFYYAKQSDLIVKSVDLSDNARPNANAVSALNLLKLYAFTYETKYKQIAKKILNNHISKARKYPRSYGQLLLALDYYNNNPKEIAIIGTEVSGESNNLVKIFQDGYYPNAVISYHNPNKKNILPLIKDKTMIKNKSTAYVCENKQCLRPTNDPILFKQQISKIKHLNF